MREIIAALADALRAGRPFALATLVDVQGSAPRPLGTTMLVRADGSVAGSLSAGCVDAAAYDRALDLLRGSGGADLTEHGPADDAGWEAGLTCGGTVRVLVRLVDGDDVKPLLGLVDALAAGRPTVLWTVVDGSHGLGRQLLVDDAGAAVGTLGDAGLDRAASEGSAATIASGRPLTGVLPGAVGAVAVLAEPFLPPPRLVVVGSDDVAAQLARLAAGLGYAVTVCDARAAFANRQRFPDVDVVVDWPDRYLEQHPPDHRTVLCLLTHEPRFETPVLVRALRGPAAYIGAVGSRRTHHDRVAALRAEGVTDDELQRLHSPIGLDLGGSTPAETALSIMAEVVASRHGAAGRPLTGAEGPVHRTAGTP